MKDWHFRVPTAIGGVLALVVLWGQFGDQVGLPRLHLGRTTEPRQQEFRWSGVLAPGMTIEIKGINGSVTAERSSGDRVEVLAVKVGRRSDPSLVEIATVEHAGGVTVCAVYPSPSGRRANSCTPGDGGRMNTRNNDVQVRFTIRVPAGVNLAARTVNGSIKAAALQGDLFAQTVNGSIDLSTTGAAKANTVNGSIKVEIGAITLLDDLEFNTVNGSITVVVPHGLNAEIDASTVGGRVSTDFPLMVGRRGREMYGVVGVGGATIELHTVNGSVQLRSR
ncbi:MAG: DUF4097 family beta strand repeat-containing protein [Gemmatimonadetes bacterium]|nr:DUF4097 family beta strand repeat-containing protein [Gemmatimonadota bacterium]